MDIDEQITIAEERVAKLRDIKAQLEVVLGGAPLKKNGRGCGKCGSPSHNSRTCTAQSQEPGTIQ